MTTRLFSASKQDDLYGSGFVKRNTQQGLTLLHLRLFSEQK